MTTKHIFIAFLVVLLLISLSAAEESSAKIVPDLKKIQETKPAEDIKVKVDQKEEPKRRKYAPYRQSAFSSLIDSFFDDVFTFPKGHSDRYFRSSCVGDYAPDADVHETPSEFLIELDLPGVTKDTLKINVKTEDDRDVVIVSGERKEVKKDEKDLVQLQRQRNFGKFERKWVFDKRIKKGEVVANLMNGELRIVVPKVKPTKEDEKIFNVPIL